MTESKRTKTMKISPEQKTKKSFVLRHLCPVHEVFDWNLDFINIWTTCEFIWLGEVYI